MDDAPAQITLRQWDARHQRLLGQGLREPWYGGRLGRHVDDGDYRLRSLRFDNSPASLRLWNFLLTEERRLREARRAGVKIIGTMKDLGTVPVIAYAAANTIAFYPDGAWWVPCIMQQSTGDLRLADACGIDESFCPVRAMLGAFATGGHFPKPDLLVCSSGATCDDFSAIAQRLEAMGHPVFWWEIPARRAPEGGEEAVRLPGGLCAPRSQVDAVKAELLRVRAAIEQAAGVTIGDERLREAIALANRARRMLAELRHLVFTAERCPLPALEMLVAEMLAIHYCSDRQQTLEIYAELLEEVYRRIRAGEGVLDRGAARIFWVNPVADIQVMNLLEQCGGRLCGSDFMFCHALDEIPQEPEPMEALARCALADPMVGPSRDRAQRICRDARAVGAEALVISRIPGASHCAFEGAIVHDVIAREMGIPATELEVPPVSDALRPALRNRLEALVETVRQRRAPR